MTRQTDEQMSEWTSTCVDNVTVSPETQLLQRDCATRYFSKFVLCFMSYGNDKGFKQHKWPSRSWKVNGNGAIQYVTYNFLLELHCNYVSILHRFRDIITYFPKFKEVTWLWSLNPSLLE